MGKLNRLVKGELLRLVRYKILPVSLATAVLWIGLFLFMSAEEAWKIAPLVIFVDVAGMSILLLGASHHLEKQDGTVRTMMVLPVPLGQILTAKALASMVLALESAVVTSAALFFHPRCHFQLCSTALFRCHRRGRPCGHRVCALASEPGFHVPHRHLYSLHSALYPAFAAVQRRCDPGEVRMAAPALAIPCCQPPDQFRRSWQVPGRHGCGSLRLPCASGWSAVQVRCVSAVQRPCGKGVTCCEQVSGPVQV